LNLPGIKAGEVQLTGDVLADIFARKITKWKISDKNGTPLQWSLNK
jgi:ABC-type phosphate transport system substrate-binding protein